MSSREVERVKQRRQELEQALEETIEDTIRSTGPMNALAWVAVAGGGFLLNLLILVLVTGG